MIAQFSRDLLVLKSFFAKRKIIISSRKSSLLCLVFVIAILIHHRVQGKHNHHFSSFFIFFQDNSNNPIQFALAVMVLLACFMIRSNGSKQNQQVQLQQQDQRQHQQLEDNQNGGRKSKRSYCRWRNGTVILQFMLLYSAIIIMITTTTNRLQRAGATQLISSTSKKSIHSDDFRSEKSSSKMLEPISQMPAGNYVSTVSNKNVVMSRKPGPNLNIDNGNEVGYNKPPTQKTTTTNDHQASLNDHRMRSSKMTDIDRKMDDTSVKASLSQSFLDHNDSRKSPLPNTTTKKTMVEHKMIESHLSPSFVRPNLNEYEPFPSTSSNHQTISNSFNQYQRRVHVAKIQEEVYNDFAKLARTSSASNGRRIIRRSTSPEMTVKRVGDMKGEDDDKEHEAHANHREPEVDRPASRYRRSKALAATSPAELRRLLVRQISDLVMNGTLNELRLAVSESDQIYFNSEKKSRSQLHRSYGIDHDERRLTSTNENFMFERPFELTNSQLHNNKVEVKSIISKSPTTPEVDIAPLTGNSSGNERWTEEGREIPMKSALPLTRTNIESGKMIDINVESLSGRQSSVGKRQEVRALSNEGTTLNLFEDYGNKPSASTPPPLSQRVYDESVAQVLLTTKNYNRDRNRDISQAMQQPMQASFVRSNLFDDSGDGMSDGGGGGANGQDLMTTQHPLSPVGVLYRSNRQTFNQPAASDGDGTTNQDQLFEVDQAGPTTSPTNGNLLPAIFEENAATDQGFIDYGYEENEVILCDNLDTHLFNRDQVFDLSDQQIANLSFKGSRRELLYCVERRSRYMRILTTIITPILFTIIILVGLIGNIAVPMVILENRKQEREISPPHLLMLDLSVADLSFIIFCIPFTGWDYAVGHWVFGDKWCRANQYLIVVCALSSIYTLVLMSVDRFLAVVYPIQCLQIRTSRNTLYAIVIKWLIILIISLPAAKMHGEISFRDNLQRQCRFLKDDFNALHFQIVFFLASYLLPLVLIFILYLALLIKLWYGNRPVGHRESSKMVESKKKVTWLVAGIVVVFAICWCPIQIMLIMMRLQLHEITVTYVALQVFAHILGYMNSCVNPIVYAFASENFSNSFKRSKLGKLFRTMTPWIKHVKPPEQSMHSRAGGSSAGVATGNQASCSNVRPIASPRTLGQPSSIGDQFNRASIRSSNMQPAPIERNHQPNFETKGVDGEHSTRFGPATIIEQPRDHPNKRANHDNDNDNDDNNNPNSNQTQTSNSITDQTRTSPSTSETQTSTVTGSYRLDNLTTSMDQIMKQHQLNLTGHKDNVAATSFTNRTSTCKLEPRDRCEFKVEQLRNDPLIGHGPNTSQKREQIKPETSDDVDQITNANQTSQDEICDCENDDVAQSNTNNHRPLTNQPAKQQLVAQVSQSDSTSISHRCEPIGQHI